MNLRGAAIATMLVCLLAVAPQCGLTAAPVKKQTATKATPNKSAKKRTASSKRRRRVPPAPRVSAAQKAASAEAVKTHVESALDFGFQNPAALIPFFELLYRQKEGAPGPVRVLHFGDSHTASEEWPGAVRAYFQSEFGCGGPGFVHAGKPYAGFRRLDSKADMSRGWTPAGLLARDGDGLYGLSGVSVSTRLAGETIALQASGERFQIFYYTQPGGGSLLLSIDGADAGTIQTAGEAGAGYHERTLAPGTHDFVVKSVGDGEVRLFGWVVENRGGVTWETLGINGAQADLLLGWNEDLLTSHIAHRDPALIVLAYGTNEARRKDWTYETYRAAFRQVLARLRVAAPAASLLVVGPPDQSVRLKGKWTPHDGVEMIMQAQRDAAVEAGAAFWNTRSGMGGKGSMKQWVYAGLAQGDFVHLTGPGYKLLGESLYGLMMETYSVFATFRRQAIGSTLHGSSSQDR